MSNVQVINTVIPSALIRGGMAGVAALVVIKDEAFVLTVEDVAGW